jgi:hypothetical protein
LQIEVLYFDHLVDKQKSSEELFQPLMHVSHDDLTRLFQSALYVPVIDEDSLVRGILTGQAAVFYREEEVYLADVSGMEMRNITPSETESVIVGPHDAFIESAETNLSLIRRRLRSNRLKVIQLEIGEVTKTPFFLLYLDGIANPDLVRSMIERIQRMEVDSVYDTHMLTQHIDDTALSLFPQFLTTERPEGAVSKLMEGRLIGILDHSPAVICAPTTIFEFFTSPDDYYQRWMVGTATRLLRYLAFIITTSLTALYVSLTSHHYEMIPETLLLTLLESRERVPFPPVYEAILMETTIELLREAGARLPTKIGQTIGIVGGIVIGQAAVQAGITSNILIIAMALSAIASFAIPSYVMSASLRLLRFGLILLAGMWGNLGIAFGMAWLVIHLTGLTSLGISYTNPVAPIRWKDWKDTFIRAPFQYIRERPETVHPANPVRQKPRK